MGQNWTEHNKAGLGKEGQQNQDTIDEDRNALCLKIFAFSIIQNQTKLHTRTLQQKIIPWTKNVPSTSFFACQAFDLFIQLGTPPLPCSSKWGWERRPTLNLFISSNLCPFSCCILNYVWNVFACSAMSQCSASQYQFMPLNYNLRDTKLMWCLENTWIHHVAAERLRVLGNQK